MMAQSIRTVGLGLFIMLLSWIVWKDTGNFWGWLALFIPGGIYVLLGCVFTIEDDDG
jgi:hypothetical protein